MTNDADIAIAVGKNTHEELSSIPLRKEKLVLVTDQSETENDLKKLLRKPLLVFPSGCAYRKVLERMLTDYGIAEVRMMAVSSLGSILASISAGLGVSVFPASAITAFTAGDSLRMIPLPKEYEAVDIYLVNRRQSAGNRTLSDFITTITTEGK